MQDSVDCRGRLWAARHGPFLCSGALFAATRGVSTAFRQAPASPALTPAGCHHMRAWLSCRDDARRDVHWLASIGVQRAYARGSPDRSAALRLAFFAQLAGPRPQLLEVVAVGDLVHLLALAGFVDLDRQL